MYLAVWTLVKLYILCRIQHEFYRISKSFLKRFLKFIELLLRQPFFDFNLTDLFHYVLLLLKII